MFVRAHIGRSILAGFMAAAATFTAAPAQATAPTKRDSVTVRVDQLILEPGDRGYRGSLAVVVKFQASQPTYFNLSLTEPVAGSFDGIQPPEACWWEGIDPAGRRIMGCAVPGGELAPNRPYRFTLDFEVLTTPQSYPMVADDGVLTLQSGRDSTVSATARFATLFRSTSGSLEQPQPYVPDTQSNISITAGEAPLTRQADGTFSGRATVTVRYGGDAPHWELSAWAELPAGIQFDGIDPPDACGGLYCPVPGGKFMEGEVRTFDLLLSAPADTPVGPLGSGSVTVAVNWLIEITDVDPADNTAAFALTAVEAS